MLIFVVVVCGSISAIDVFFCLFKNKICQYFNQQIVMLIEVMNFFLIASSLNTEKKGRCRYLLSF